MNNYYINKTYEYFEFAATSRSKKSGNHDKLQHLSKIYSYDDMINIYESGLPMSVVYSIHTKKIFALISSNEGYAFKRANKNEAVITKLDLNYYHWEINHCEIVVINENDVLIDALLLPLLRNKSGYCESNRMYTIITSEWESNDSDDDDDEITDMEEINIVVPNPSFSFT